MSESDIAVAVLRSNAQIKQRADEDAAVFFRGALAATLLGATLLGMAVWGRILWALIGG